jgi:hypothetical protein
MLAGNAVPKEAWYPYGTICRICPSQIVRSQRPLRECYHGRIVIKKPLLTLNNMNHWHYWSELAVRWPYSV